jgi:hypothetical protein
MKDGANKMRSLMKLSPFAACVVLTAAVGFAQEFYTPTQDLGGLQKNAQTNDILPNVLLIGDSISIGYTKPVTELLKDVANVQRPPVNCGNTKAGLSQLDRWLGDTPWDVIHFNWGLHDLCYRHPDSPVGGRRDKVNGVQDVPIKQYEENLNRLVSRLEKTGAILIWATTTPVPEGEAGRFAGDELKYNVVAEKIMKQHGVRINDLYALAAGFDDACIWPGAGNVHFKPAGSAKLAAQVATTVEIALVEMEN